MSGLLKRKFKEVDEDPCYSSPSSLSSAGSGWDSEGESCYSDTLDSNPSNPNSPATNYNSEYASSLGSSSALQKLLCELEIHFLEPCFLLHKDSICKHVNRRAAGSIPRKNARPLELVLLLILSPEVAKWQIP